MGANLDRPHILVLPEDDANRQLVNGFLLEIDWIRQRQLQVLKVAGGWKRVLECFRDDHIKDLKRYSHRFIVLLTDFDGQKDRFDKAKAVVPEELKDQVFIIGVWSEPEDLRKAGLGSPETIGKALAKDCREETDTTWGHALLQHNAGELDRLRKQVRPLLFSSI